MVNIAATVENRRQSTKQPRLLTKEDIPLLYFVFLRPLVPRRQRLRKPRLPNASRFPKLAFGCFSACGVSTTLPETEPLEYLNSHVAFARVPRRTLYKIYNAESLLSYTLNQEFWVTRQVRQLASPQRKRHVSWSFCA